MRIADVGCAKALGPLPLNSESIKSCVKMSDTDNRESNYTMNAKPKELLLEPKKKHTLPLSNDMLQTPHCISL